MRTTSYTLYIQADLHNVRELRLSKDAPVSFRLKSPATTSTTTSDHHGGQFPPPLTGTSDTETEDRTDTRTNDTVTLLNQRDSRSSLCSEKLTKGIESRNSFSEHRQASTVGDSENDHLIKISFLRPPTLSSADSGRHVPFIHMQCQRQIEPCSFDIFGCDYTVATEGGNVFDFICLEDGGNWSDFDERMGAVSTIANLNANWVETRNTMMGEY